MPDIAPMHFLEEVLIDGEAVGELRIKIRELPMADGVHGSTGCQLWPTSIVLAQEIMRRPSLVEDRFVMEVGAGCGLSGIAAARLARRTVITDADEEAVRNSAHNLELNQSCWQSSDGEIPREACTRTFNWEEALVDWNGERPEVVLASDVIYGNWGEILAQALMNMLAPGGLILMAASRDRRSSVRSFQKYLEEVDFLLQETLLSVPLGIFYLYECWQRRAGENNGPLPMAVRNHTAKSSPFRPTEVSMDVPDDSEASSDGQTLGCCTATPENCTCTQDVSAVQESPDTFDPPNAANERKVSLWKVVGKGIIVRLGRELSQPALGRLQFGAVVEERHRMDTRMFYKKLSGMGPTGGWISTVSSRGKPLLVRSDELFS